MDHALLLLLSQLWEWRRLFAVWLSSRVCSFSYEILGQSSDFRWILARRRGAWTCMLCCSYNTSERRQGEDAISLSKSLAWNIADHLEVSHLLFHSAFLPYPKVLVTRAILPPPELRPFHLQLHPSDCRAIAAFPPALRVSLPIAQHL